MSFSAKDLLAWRQYQNTAKSWTQEAIDNLNCSDEMKAQIAADVRVHNAGGQLPEMPSTELDVYDVGYNGTDWRWL